MNKLSQIIVAGVLSLAIAVPAIAQEGKSYGKKFEIKEAIIAEELSSSMSDDARDNVVVVGEITEVCQAEGCWMKLKVEGGKDIFVKFKDHAFLIPKDMGGRKAHVFGTAKKKIVSVEDQKHYLEDAGKSDEEIAAITEPKEELRIDAEGVIIY